MSSEARKVGKRVKEQRSRMYMDNMYELFNLSLFQLLKLRHEYLSYMKKRERDHKKLAKAIRRRYDKQKVQDFEY